MNKTQIDFKYLQGENDQSFDFDKFTPCNLLNEVEFGQLADILDVSIVQV